ncbi:MAG: hypothetical protein DMF61_03715 [Blastocatellia bacterium AA13]|nr:MAG: hypothetical protein DMF61_03715 [Blastocatellia bacterium AA13]
MDFLQETRFIERLQFFNGERLDESDLQGLEAFNREMRWLHNASLHQPGIGNGFAVSGKKGDREVQIGPGYAIDALGREIVMTQSRIEAVPPVAKEDDGSAVLFDLTVSYPDDQYLEAAETRVGICTGPGVIRLKEEPVFCWVKLRTNGQPVDPSIKQEILSGMRIILCRAEVLNCQLYKDVSIAQRLNARPAKQPYICCASADLGWKEWTIGTFDADAMDFQGFIRLLFSGLPMILPVGLQAVIDTSSCGFLTTPCYNARISGPRLKQFEAPAPGGNTIESSEAGSILIPFIADGQIQIVDPSPTSFTVNVLLMVQTLVNQQFTGGVSLVAAPSGSAGDAIGKLIEKYFSDWDLVWMGVEG